MGPTAAPGRVVVVGGGLAGLTAACTLAEGGADVTLLESRARLGGATFSFTRTGFPGPLDNGQHVVLGAYVHYLALLRRLGTASSIELQPALRIPVLSPGARPGALAAPRLPAPVHAAAALARYRLLRPAERLSAVRAARALGGIDPADPDADATSFGAWLRAHGQTERSVAVLWGLLCQAALNVDPDEASLASAAMVVRTAFLGTAEDSRIGIPTAPLDEVHVEPAARFLREHGGRVRTGATVRSVRRDRGGFTVRTDSGEDHADAVVVAVPAHAAGSVLPEGALADPTAPTRLGASPIVNVHLVLDRRVLDEPFVAVVGSLVPFVFDRSPRPVREGPATGGQYLSVPLSAATEWLDRPAREVSDAVVGALREVLPAMARARVTAEAVTRERRATFRQSPGSGRLRPPSRTAVAGLALAGAWTATGWPDTIEGAVRSGEAAAAVAVAHLAARRRSPRPLPTPAPTR